MAESENTIYKCFEKLNHRLFEIINGNLVKDHHNPAYLIESISENGIHGLDPEDVQDEVISIKERIEKILTEIVTIVDKLEIKPVTENDQVFDNSIELVDPVTKRKAIAGIISKELSYYIGELDKYYAFAGTRILTSGSVLSNAGFKLNFNLTIEEIGTLFEGLKAANVIEMVNGVNGKKISNIELANWISKNCTSKSSKKGKPGKSISFKYINNHFNFKKKVSILKYLNNVIDGINEKKTS